MLNTSVTASQPPGKGLTTWSRCFACLGRGMAQFSEPQALATCHSGVSIGFFEMAVLWRPPLYFGFRLDQALPPVEGPDAFGWARENLLMPLTKDGEAGLGVRRVYLSGRSPQLVQVTNPALTHLF